MLEFMQWNFQAKIQCQLPSDKEVDAKDTQLCPLFTTVAGEAMHCCDSLQLLWIVYHLHDQILDIITAADFLQNF